MYLACTEHSGKIKNYPCLWSMVVLATSCFCLITPKTKLGYDKHIVLDLESMGWYDTNVKK
jgi:hypothetical protein